MPLADQVKFDISRGATEHVVSVVDQVAEITATQRGSPPGHPIYSVYLEKKSLKVLRAQYSR